LVIVVGPPGSGKTTLANQMAFAAARSGRRAMVLTALSEPTGKLIAHLRNFRFYNDELVGDSILFMSLQQYLSGGLEATGDELVAASACQTREAGGVSRPAARNLPQRKRRERRSREDGPSATGSIRPLLLSVAECLDTQYATGDAVHGTSSGAASCCS
jgi:hypothetical protein